MQGGCKESPRRVRGGCKENARRVQGGCGEVIKHLEGSLVRHVSKKEEKKKSYNGRWGKGKRKKTRGKEEEVDLTRSGPKARRIFEQMKRRTYSIPCKQKIYFSKAH